VPVTPRIRTDDLLVARNMIRAGAGVGVLPLFLAHDDLQRGALTRVFPRWSMAVGSLFFVHPAGKQPRKVIALRDFLADFIASVRTAEPRPAFRASASATSACQA
jgi:DNA-binding transcriptional LysR family regulator